MSGDPKTIQLQRTAEDGTLTVLDIDLDARTVREASVPASEPTAGTPELASRRYVVEQRVGRGGFADVVRARDARLDRVVALKVPRADVGHAVDLRSEGRLAASLQHPHIVPIYDVEESDDGVPFYAMKLLEGESLGATLAAVRAGDPEARERYPLPRLLEAFRQVCLAVAYAHERGVIHRDIKPANVVLGAHGEVVLADWGIARRLGDPPGDDREVLRGTMAYLAPERLGELPEGDILTDIYALGATLYAVLAWLPPRRGTSQEILTQILAGLPAPPGELAAREIPLELESLCMRTLSVDRDARPQSASELADAVASYLDAQADEETRRQRADSRFRYARQQHERVMNATDRVGELEQELESLREEISDDAPEAQRRALWVKEQALVEARISREVVFGRAVRRFEQVLSDDEDHRLARAGLAELYWMRFEEARADGDDIQAARYEQLVRQHDLGTYRQRLDAPTLVRLEAVGLTACIRLFQFRPMGPVLERVELPEGGETPLEVERLVPGSYVAKYESAGMAPIWVPFVVDHGARRTITRRMYPTDVVPQDFVVVTGLDEDFAMARHPVTAREYLAFLNALFGKGADVDAYVPRGPSGEVYVTLRDGEWVLPERDPDGDAWHLDWPAIMISRDAAERFVEWRSTGDERLDYRLPTAEEWEWAASGPDGRDYPWGSGYDPACANLRTESAKSLPAAVGSYPLDQSPFGVFDMCGGVVEWTASQLGDTGILKGGSFNSWAYVATNRLDKLARRGEGHAHYGFRLVASLSNVHSGGGAR